MLSLLNNMCIFSYTNEMKKKHRKMCYSANMNIQKSSRRNEEWKKGNKTLWEEQLAQSQWMKIQNRFHGPAMWIWWLSCFKVMIFSPCFMAIPFMVFSDLFPWIFCNECHKLDFSIESRSIITHRLKLTTMSSQCFGWLLN